MRSGPSTLSVFGMLLAACGPAPPARADQADPIAVSVATVERRDVPIVRRALGTVQAFNSVTIRARVDGELLHIGFTEGQHVHAGDVLAEIDPRSLKAQLAQAEAAEARDQALLANARLDLQRAQELVRRQYASQQSQDTQQSLVAQYAATVRNDQAQIDFARVQLGYTTITAPLDGVAGFRMVDQGNIVHAGDTVGIVMITQVQPISVVFTLPEDELPGVKARMRAGPLEVAAFNREGTQELGRGQLAVIDNQVAQTTAMLKLKATFPNQDEALWPGQLVQARLLLDRRQGAIVVPSLAIQHGPDGPIAFVVKADHTVDVRPLSLGETATDMTIVKAGLQVGETVVTQGQFKLDAGVLVEPAPVDPPRAGP
ncbi:MAG: efflux transporter, family, subunit [Rhodospirillales bacterium]|nr:efflux transporter, family, subunit [Rhodospirillales bacterium]